MSGTPTIAGLREAGAIRLAMALHILSSYDGNPCRNCYFVAEPTTRK